MNQHRPARIRGVTGFELLLCLGIVMLVLLLASPQLGPIIAQHQIRAAAAHLKGDLAHARSIAIGRITRTTVCAGNPREGCNDAPWHSGWISFFDADGDRQRSENEELLRTHEGIGHLSIIGSRHRTRLSFFPSGTAPGRNARFTFCAPAQAAAAHQFRLSVSGRIRTSSNSEFDHDVCRA